MADFIAGCDTGDRVLGKHGRIDGVLSVVHNQLPLVVRAYRSIQVATLAFFKQERLTEYYCCSILRHLVSIHRSSAIAESAFNFLTNEER
jgi:hypothetical protein